MTMEKYPEYREGFNDAKAIAAAIVERFIKIIPEMNRDLIVKHVLEPIESMVIKIKEFEQ